MLLISLILLCIFVSPLIYPMDCATNVQQTESKAEFYARLISKINTSEEESLTNLCTGIAFITINYIHKINWDLMDSNVNELPTAGQSNDVRAAWARTFMDISNVWLKYKSMQREHFRYIILFDDDLGSVNAKENQVTIDTIGAGEKLSLEFQRKILIDHCELLCNLPMPDEIIGTGDMFF